MLDEALSQVPGLSLFRRDSSLSANPTTQGVSLRSIAPSGAGRALVTLDGVPQNDPFGNWVIWSALPGEDMRAGQIVRGAGAGPYGAGNPEPLLALADLRVAFADVVGGAHVKLRLAGRDGTVLDAIAFRASGTPLGQGLLAARGSSKRARQSSISVGPTR